MGPSLILDKSTLQSLSHNEMEILRRYFSLAVPPILLLEILADLKKRPGSDRDPSVQGLARRIVPSSSLPVLPNYRELIRAEIAGARIAMDHRPVLLKGQKVRTAEGERGTILPPSREEQALLRWQQGDFEAAEELLAEQYRCSICEMDTEELQRQLQSEYSKRLTLGTLSATAEFVEDLVASGNPKLLLQWFFGDTLGESTLPDSVLPQAGVRSGLDQRFPYTSYCMKVSLLFHFGLAFRHISTRPTNRVDLEYFFYLPFSLGFSSGDQLHRDLFQHVSLPKNDFCHRDDLKHDLRRLWNHGQNDPEALKRVKPPELAADSFTAQMWAKHMKPVSQNRENLAKSLSPEAQRRLIDKYKSMMNGEMDDDPTPEGNVDFLFRPMEIHRDGPCICGSSKSFRECCGAGI